MNPKTVWEKVKPKWQCALIGFTSGFFYILILQLLNALKYREPLIRTVEEIYPLFFSSFIVLNLLLGLIGGVVGFSIGYAKREKRKVLGGIAFAFVVFSLIFIVVFTGRFAAL